jgi:hypothetical protein
MTAISEIKSLPPWTSELPTQGPSSSQDAQEEIRQLLREIRDLQKAHFERYQEFTGKIMAGEKTREQDANRLYIEQLHHQEDMRRAAFQHQLISWAVWGAIVVLCMGGMYLFQMMNLMGF